jgi:hypothetical protein
MSLMAIDEWLPQYQVSASYSIFVRASAERTNAVITQVNFSDLPMVRGLMRLRGYRLGNIGVRGPEARQTVGGSFLELATVPRREVVLGIAGKFWRPDGGIVQDLGPAEFARFRREGFAKAVWNFSLAPADGGTQLATETRVQTFGRSATLKFRAYWFLIGPFSGLIRRAMLREVKRMAEQRTR